MPFIMYLLETMCSTLGSCGRTGVHIAAALEPDAAPSVMKMVSCIYKGLCADVVFAQSQGTFFYFPPISFHFESFIFSVAEAFLTRT
jgi:hypothetical protein